MEHINYSSSEEGSDEENTPTQRSLATGSVSEVEEEVAWEVNLARLLMMVNTFRVGEIEWAVYARVQVREMQPNSMMTRSTEVQRVMGYSLWATQDLARGSCLPYGGVGISDIESQGMSSRVSCYVCGDLFSDGGEGQVNADPARLPDGYPRGYWVGSLVNEAVRANQVNSRLVCLDEDQQAELKSKLNKSEWYRRWPLDCRYLLEVTRKVTAGEELILSYGDRDPRADLYTPAWKEKEYRSDTTVATQAKLAKKTKGASNAERARSGKCTGKQSETGIAADGSSSSAVRTGAPRRAKRVAVEVSISELESRKFEAGRNGWGSPLESFLAPGERMPRAGQGEEVSNSEYDWAWWVYTLVQRYPSGFTEELFEKGGVISWQSLESSLFALRYGEEGRQWTTRAETAVEWARELMRDQQAAKLTGAGQSDSV